MKYSVLSDSLADKAIRVFPFSHRLGLYFADTELIVRFRDSVTEIGASSLAFGEAVAATKCKSELLERWAYIEWQWDGCPNLKQIGFWSDKSLGYPSKIAVSRRDATGMCAGPEQIRSRVLLHGLLEVLERDAVTRLFDRGEGILRSPVSTLPDELIRFADRWRGGFEIFVFDRWYHPPVAIVMFFTKRGDAGAIGTACRLSEYDACVHAATEAIMMFTTARHWARQPSVPPQYAGLVWASRSVAVLSQELWSHHVTKASHGDASVIEAHLPQIVADHFGSEPSFCKFPTKTSTLAGLGVWRVSVPNTLSPASVTRSPWPIG